MDPQALNALRVIYSDGRYHVRELSAGRQYQVGEIGPRGGWYAIRTYRAQYAAESLVRALRRVQHEEL